MNHALTWFPSSRKVWENWEGIARTRPGVTTQTLLTVEAALHLTLLNEDDRTRRKAADDPAGIAVTRVIGTNVRILGTVDGNDYTLLAIEPHPFMVETY